MVSRMFKELKENYKELYGTTKNLVGTIGLSKNPYGLFCKMKGTFFIFTNDFIDLDILNMLAISHML